MTNRSAITSRAVLLLVTSLCLVGCGGSDNETSNAAPPFAGQALSIHVPESAGLAAVLEPLVEEWNARTGAAAGVVEYSATQQPKPADGDVVVVTPADVSAIASQLAVVPEGTPGREELNWNQMFRGLRDRVAKRGTEPRVVPISCSPLLCYYRKDLVEAAGLGAPKTWAEYNRLVNTIEEWAPGLKAVEPWGKDFRTSMLTARSIAYASPRDSLGLFFDLDNGDPRLSTPGFARAVDEFKTIAPQLEHCWEMTPGQCRTALLDGTAGIGITFEPAIAPPASDHGEGVRLGFCRLPGSTEVYSRSLGEWNTETPNQPGLVGFDGYVAGVAEHTDVQAVRAGFNLLAAVLAETCGSASSPIRGFTANWQADIAAPIFEPQLTIDESTDYVKAAVTTLQESHLVVALPVSNNAPFQSILSEIVTRESVAGQSTEEILKGIDDAWRSIISDRGAADFVSDYRRNIGVRQKRQ